MDHNKVTEFLGRFVTDLGAAGAAGSVAIGHRLGLYRALAEGPATPERFAERTGCHPRYLAEWLRGQAAGGYVDYDPATGAFSLTEEQAFCLADPNGPNVPSAFLIVLGYLRAEPRLTEAFRTGGDHLEGYRIITTKHHKICRFILDDIIDLCKITAIDATSKFKGVEVPEINTVSKELTQKVLSRWAELGLE